MLALPVDVLTAEEEPCKTTVAPLIGRPVDWSAMERLSVAAGAGGRSVQLMVTDAGPAVGIAPEAFVMEQDWPGG
jgi:hypothetical protein